MTKYEKILSLSKYAWITGSTFDITLSALAINAGVAKENYWFTKPIYEHFGLNGLITSFLILIPVVLIGINYLQSNAKSNRDKAVPLLLMGAGNILNIITTVDNVSEIFFKR
ncbi:hypothetical protein A2767_07175 [Candidatus Roizmanbacteria bacterium RIFCSPHIGHO2_01_FULL_35_10]|uniref:DUF5658 domain-containing protein n=1 Tax=Candidatus Roizmanbacteria bacterium RIFCSPLOWO2_01_FULL_35_13 TaxID=1802055 RepID=A0A1F7I805_9BACT|nr:MAG: hypothetical protein A2767_07175 [Candidatus Roizmanbacteria bacterium RIFCSPHIGHO2_01_FULL_35_10]OGK39498.1 MAG: hypothetical protein A3A74_00565 [Candidatus Roizmanbacteria bacterium RIFCSPLOWO2_01_FULL_35_13]